MTNTSKRQTLQVKVIKTPHKRSITHRLRTDLGRPVGATTVIQLVWLTKGLRAKTSHFGQVQNCVKPSDISSRILRTRLTKYAKNKLNTTVPCEFLEHFVMPKKKTKCLWLAFVNAKKTKTNLQSLQCEDVCKQVVSAIYPTISITPSLQEKISLGSVNPSLPLWIGFTLVEHTVSLPHTLVNG